MKVEKKREKQNFIWRKILIVFGWILLWQIAALLIDNSILLETPIAVLKRLFEDLQTREYYKTVGNTMLYINAGFLLGLIFAILCSIFAWKQKIIEEILAPLVQFLKAAPIACFIVLLLIWAGSKNLAFYVALIVAFPPIYLNLLEGLGQIPKGQMEVAKVFAMPLKNRMRFIYLPALEPYFISAVRLTVGMVFKAGIAAEIIGTPDYSMGERIYMSKIYLDTAGVLSWLVTIIFVSFLCEKFYVKVTNFYFHKKPTGKLKSKNYKSYEMKNLMMKDLTVSFGKEKILDNVTCFFETGKTYCIIGASGIGKTTFLRSICGLQKIEKGDMTKFEGVKSFVFQDNRLFEEYTAGENVFATGQCTMTLEAVEKALEEILPPEALKKPIREYSGGMKRRVEIARAMLSDSVIVLLDEAFNGLDEATKENTITFIKKYQKGRTILFTTHLKDDVRKMQGEEVYLWKNE